MPHNDPAWAGLSAAGDPALRDWLEGAACDPHVKAIAVQALQAFAHGRRASQWQHDLIAEHPGASVLLAEAEQCMRRSGVVARGRLGRVTI